MVPAVVRLAEGVREGVERYVFGAAHPRRVGELRLLRLRLWRRVVVEHHVEVKRQGHAQAAGHHAAVNRPSGAQG